MNAAQSKFLVSLALVTGLSGAANASIFLPPGTGPTPLPGATAAAEPDLAGVVLHDVLLPFHINNAGGALLFDGQLQNRVVKSTRTGRLHFYYAIRNTRPGLNGIVRALYTKSFAATPQAFADFRPDGLGTVKPVSAARNAGGGETIQFAFVPSATRLVGGLESRFFFVKTSAFNFVGGGLTYIQLTTGESVAVNTVVPTP